MSGARACERGAHGRVVRQSASVFSSLSKCLPGNFIPECDQGMDPEDTELSRRGHGAKTMSGSVDSVFDLCELSLNPLFSCVQIIRSARNPESFDPEFTEETQRPRRMNCSVSSGSTSVFSVTRSKSSSVAAAPLCALGGKTPDEMPETSRLAPFGQDVD
jgi:hypothetical protein